MRKRLGEQKRSINGVGDIMNVDKGDNQEFFTIEILVNFPNKVGDAINSTILYIVLIDFV